MIGQSQSAHVYSMEVETTIFGIVPEYPIRIRLILLGELLVLYGLESVCLLLNHAKKMCPTIVVATPTT